MLQHDCICKYAKDWVKAVKVFNTLDLSIRVRFKEREHGLGIYIDALRKMCIRHAITGISRTLKPTRKTKTLILPLF